MQFRIWDKAGTWLKSLSDNKVSLSIDGKFLIINRSNNVVSIHNLDSFIIHRCTDVKDKRGRMIYEGDYLEVPTQGGSAVYAEVKFGNHLAMSEDGYHFSKVNGWYIEWKDAFSRKMTESLMNDSNWDLHFRSAEIINNVFNLRYD